MKNQIIILTGPPGAGKSTIGKILASKIEKSAIVSSDDLRDMVKMEEQKFVGKAGKNNFYWERKMLFVLRRIFIKMGLM